MKLTPELTTSADAMALLGYHDNGLSAQDENISNRLISIRAKMCISKLILIRWSV